MINAAIADFLSHLQLLTRASEHTCRNYKNDLMIFQNFLEKNHGSPTLHSIDKRVIRQFMLEESEKTSTRSLARRLSSLRSFFKFCLKTKKLSSNPMETIETPKISRTIPKTLTYEQIHHFLELPDISTYLGFRDKTIMELFYSSGIRVSELAALNKEDFDHQELLLKVQGKGNRERIVPMTENAALWISNYLTHPSRHLSSKDHVAEKDPHAIFLNKLGSRLSTRSIDRLFRHYFQLSGFTTTITPHIIRHSIATHWLEQGMDLKTIQKILGHTSMATTTIYTAVSTTRKKQAIKDHHPRG